MNATTPPGVIDAITKIPALLAGMLSPYCREPSRRPWFPAVARNAEKAIIGASSSFESADDVHRALRAYAVRVAEKTLIERTALPLATDKWIGQQWVVDGVYDNSFRGLNELRHGELFVRSLSGERRFRILARFCSHRDADRFAREVVFHGVRDPLDASVGYFTEEAISDLPGLFVWALAALVLDIPGKNDLPGLEVLRRAPDSVSARSDAGFLLRAIKRGAPVSSEDVNRKDCSDSRTILEDWLLEQESLWRGPARGTGSLFGYMGRSIKNKAIDGSTKAEEFTGIELESALDAIYQRQSLGVTRSLPKSPDADYGSHGEHVADIDVELFDRDSDRLTQIDDGVIRPEVETPEVDTPEVEISAKERRNRASVGDCMARLGRNFATRRRGEFEAAYAQVERDIELAFRAVYKADARGIALRHRDQRAFLHWHFPRDIPYDLTVSFADPAAAEKSIQRHMGELKVWFRAGGYCPTSTARREQREKPEMETKVKYRRPEFLDGCRLPRIEIKHGWQSGKHAVVTET